MPAGNPGAYGLLAQQLAGPSVMPTGNWSPPPWVTPPRWSSPNQGGSPSGSISPPGTTPIPGQTPGFSPSLVPGQGPGSGIDFGQMIQNAAGNAAAMVPLSGLMGGDDSQQNTQAIQQAVQQILNQQQNASLAGTPLHIGLSGPMPGNAMFGGYELPAWNTMQANLNTPPGLLDAQPTQGAPATLQTDLSTIMGNPQMSPAGTRLNSMGSYRGGAGMVQGVLDPSTINQIDPVGPRNILPPQFRPGRGILQ